MGQSWPIESGDALNSTAPVLVAVDSGVIIAGASSDPATVGLAAFDSGISSEAFVARLDADGQPLWSVPLLPAGLPWAIARSGDDVVIVAAYLPTLAEVSTSYVSKDIYLAKLGIDGTVRFEATVIFDHEDTMGYGLAIAADGSIYLSGGYQEIDEVTGFGGHPIVIKCDASGAKLWEKTFTHSGTQGYGSAVAVLASGDIVVTGTFDGDLSFGGDTDTISSTATLVGLPSGYLARLTKDGDPIWSQVFGSEDFSVGNALTALANGDFMLAGSVALDLTIGGITVMGEPHIPSDDLLFPPTAAFVARLTGDGDASWVELTEAGTYSHALATDGGNTVFLGGSLDKDPSGSDVYLRTYDARQGDALQAIRAQGGTGIETRALAVGSGSLWLSGIFSTNADFGNDNLLTSPNAGVFLVRLDAQ
jgi:hypothetical protein